MAPIQVIILLVLIRLPALLASQSPATQPATLPMTHFQWLTIISYLGSMLLLSLYVFARARITIRNILQTSTSASSVAARFDRLLPAARWATILFTAVHLYLPANNSIPAIVAGLLHHTVLLKHIPLLAEALYFAPVLLAWIAFWTAQYFVETAYRERSLPFRLASELPAHEMPPLSSFLSMQIRHNFYLLLPILIITLIEEATDHMVPWFPQAPALGVATTVLVLLLMMPWMITRLWATTPLTGPLRTRLDALAKTYRLRFKNILIWKTHNAMTNAAILGYLPFSRYFLMTDALLETLTDQQIEAVFAHEVGHGYHRHLWWYAIGFLSAVFLTSSVAGLLVTHLPLSVIAWVDTPNNAELLLSMLLLAPIGLLGFPFVSHRFEHQADYFAATHMGLAVPQPPSPVNVPVAQPPSAVIISDSPSPVMNYQLPTTPTPLATPDPAPSPGTETFVSALDTIVELAHRSRDHGGWMHPSINNRIRFLRLIATSPQEKKAFARRMLATRLLIVALALAAIALTAYITLVPSPNSSTTTAPATATSPRSPQS